MSRQERHVLSPQTRKVLLGVNSGIALAHIGNYIWFPHLISTLGVEYSGFWAGFVMFLTYVGRLSATFFYEGVAARFGTRTSIIAGIAVEAVALGGMGFADGVPFYSLLAFFVGFGSGISFPGLKNILGTLPAADRPKAFSSFQMSCQLGVIAGAVIGGLFLGSSMTILFLVVFVLFAGYCAAAASFIPADAGDLGDPAAKDTPLVNVAILKGLQLGGGGSYFLLSSVFWILSISFLVGMPLHMEEFAADLPVSTPFWITGLALLVLQYPAFRFMSKHLRPGQVMGVAFLAMAAAYALFGAGQTAVWVVVGCLVVVFGDILFTPSFDLWVADRMPADRLARAMGAMHFFRSFGNMVGTLAAGALYDLSRSTDIPGLNWYAVGAIALVCAAVSFSSAKKEGAAPEQGTPAFAKTEAAPVAEPVGEPRQAADSTA
ncbi:MFS transporter [Streptomyces sp. NE06-03E]|uniref:MFS transporter n=1 Tax=Streptomyces silvae TaxID=2803812 RepID=A0ABU8A2D1_9ACTN|nr:MULTISPECIES: MFS transporter [unclassified Streptomyces]MDX3054920.1 MFS transporter [Streptomyces sp. NE06-03E]MDX3327529.1 MFS transporter [Streptomyces sp. ME02-6979-3A]WSS76269.1 MFS transporter [Streptomyces sp. NBC_01174]